MVSSDTLLAIVTSGANLTIATPIDYGILLELIDMSQTSGSQLTITTRMSSKIIKQILSKKLTNVSFIHLKKDS